MRKAALLRLINFWPPFLGSGVRVTHIAADFTAVDVELRLKFWNRNYVGTHFGGSLYAMTDPFFMLMLIENLGRDYIVWDKAATIKFKQPGRGLVLAKFRLSRQEINDIRLEADSSPKVEPVFNVQVCDKAGRLVAEVEKTLYVSRKDPRRSKAS